MRTTLKLFRVVCSFCLLFAFWYFLALAGSLLDLALVVAVVFVVPAVTWTALWASRRYLGWWRR